MSLLNDALRDLERRNDSSRAPTNSVPPGLSRTRSSRRPRLLGALALLVSAVAAAGYLLSNGQPSERMVDAEVQKSSQPADTGAVPPVAASAPAIGLPPEQRQAAQPAPAAAEKTTATRAAAEPVVALQPTVQEALHKGPAVETATVARKGAAPSVAVIPPPAATEPAPAKPVTVAESPERSPEPQKAPAKREPAGMGAVAAEPTGEDRSDRDQTGIKQLPQSPEARDERLALALERLLIEGREEEAGQRLESEVARGYEMPRAHAAMARYYLAQERLTEARRWLPLSLAESDFGLRLLRGRLLLLEDGAMAALEYLAPEHPTASQAPDYIATLAALYQQTGQHKDAGKHWLALLDTDSQRPDYWLGLALALDAQDETKAARLAYAEALALPQMSPRLRSFAQSRLDALL